MEEADEKGGAGFAEYSGDDEEPLLRPVGPDVALLLATYC